MKKIFILATIVTALMILLIAGCTTKTQSASSETSSPTATDWKEFSLKDISTQKEFKIADFRGKSILVETFAVWCPKCLQQQQEIKKLHEQNKEIISISLDTDPNEDETKVLSHIRENQLTWLIAVAPPDFTRAIIQEYGNAIVSAPSTPVILICPDLSTRLLPTGIKSSEKLLAEIQKGC